jgi:acetylornithine/N-succinyldiaminopimelate aminotransferase
MTTIPSSDPSTVAEVYKRNVMPTYAPSVVLKRGRGIMVWDADGKKYIDLLAGIATNTLGHAHPAVVRAVRHQVGQLTHISNLFINENAAKLAEFLSRISLGGKCFFCNSGAEANEGLIKLARYWGNHQDSARNEIITFKNSFHGRTLATLSATGQEKIQKGFAPLMPGFSYAEYNNIESVKALIGPRTVAILVEPIQGEGGVIPAAPDFLRRLRELCDAHNLLLLYDEIQTGVGRTGQWFAYQHFNVPPDAFSLAKGLGAGVPIGAVVAGPKLADTFQPGAHGSTFGGNPLACAAALAVLQTIEKKNLLENARKCGAYLEEKLLKLATRFPFIKGVRGVGLMRGLVLDRPGKELEKLITLNGVLTVATGADCIRILPPLIITPANIRSAVRCIAKACKQFQQTIDKEQT